MLLFWNKKKETVTLCVISFLLDITFSMWLVIIYNFSFTYLVSVKIIHKICFNIHFWSINLKLVLGCLKFLAGKICIIHKMVYDLQSCGWMRINNRVSFYGGKNAFQSYFLPPPIAFKIHFLRKIMFYLNIKKICITLWVYKKRSKKNIIFWHSK